MRSQSRARFSPVTASRSKVIARAWSGSLNPSILTYGRLAFNRSSFMVSCSSISFLGVGMFANRELVRYFIFNPSKRRRNVSSDEFSGFHEASEGSFTCTKIRHHPGDSTPAPRADQRNTTVEIPQQVLCGIRCEASDEGLHCVAASPLFYGSSNIPRGLGSRTVYGGAPLRSRSPREPSRYSSPHLFFSLSSTPPPSFPPAFCIPSSP